VIHCFQGSFWRKVQKNSIYLIIFNTVEVFTVTFVFNSSLLNRSIHLFKKLLLTNIFYSARMHETDHSFYVITIAGSLCSGNFKDCGLLNIYNALYLGIIDYASERVFVSQLVRIACWRLDTCAIFQQRGWTLMWRTKVVSLVTPSSQTALCQCVCEYRKRYRHIL